MLNIGNRLECFFDDYLVNTAQTTAEFRIHAPRRWECVLHHDAPWEGDGCDYHNFFYDNGIRNSIIQNFSPLQLRDDVGALWENFVISERLKYNHYNQRYCNTYFWRTTEQQEVDYIEERDGSFSLFEMKWNPKKAKVLVPSSFKSAYGDCEYTVITPENYWQHLV